MLVLLPGKERTASEYGKLFAAAGLKLERVHATHSPFSIVEIGDAFATRGSGPEAAPYPGATMVAQPRRCRRFVPKRGERAQIRPSI